MKTYKATFKHKKNTALILVFFITLIGIIHFFNNHNPSVFVIILILCLALFAIQLIFFVLCAQSIQINAKEIIVKPIALRKQKTIALKSISNVSKVEIPIRGGFNHLSIKHDNTWTIIFCDLLDKYADFEQALDTQLKKDGKNLNF